MLFKLSINNIKKSLKDYAVYFFTLMIGVSIFYIFNSLDSQTAFIQASSSASSAIELLNEVINVLSVFVSVVLGLLLVYANRFLMKRRSKEFAVYMMLGMSKTKISLILLTETILIGITSLLTGLMLGIGLSQLTSALAGNMFEADMSLYKFNISPNAIVKSIVYFGIMYLIVMLFNAVMIGKTKLINLINYGRSSEKMKMKNPALCAVIFIIASIGLGFAYYQVTANMDLLNFNKLLVMIIIGIVTTFLILWSVSGMLLRLIMSLRKTYLKGLNSFTFRQLSSKINTMVLSMTVICLMLFVTICTLSSAFSIKSSMNDTLNTNCPADIQLYSYIMEKPDELPLLADFCKEKGFDITKYAEEVNYLTTYYDEDFSYEKFAGDSEMSEKLTNYLGDGNEELVPLSKYNELMRLYGKNEESLEKDQFILCCDYDIIKELRDERLSTDKNIEIFGNKLTSKYDKCNPDGFIALSAQHINYGFFVVPDEIIDNNLDKAYISTDFITGKFGTDNKKECIKLSESALEDYNNTVNSYIENYFVRCTTKIELANDTVGLAVIVTFIGLYIGIVFLIACGAILSLKELSESADSAVRYDMLRKIGVEEKDISHSLLTQTGLFFIIPLTLAMIHSIFGMKFSAIILKSMGASAMLSSAGITAAIIIAIYGGYFLITYTCSKNIIKAQR